MVGVQASGIKVWGGPGLRPQRGVRWRPLEPSGKCHPSTLLASFCSLPETQGRLQGQSSTRHLTKA